LEKYLTAFVYKGALPHVSPKAVFAVHYTARHAILCFDVAEYRGFRIDKLILHRSFDLAAAS